MFPRDELWIRKVYEPEVVDGTLTRIFKPDNRLYPNTKGFNINEKVKVKIVEIPGNDKTRCMPIVNKNYRMATINNMIVTDINSLRKKDFIGASKDVYDAKSLRYNLGLLYDKTPESFDKITIIDIKYL